MNRGLEESTYWRSLEERDGGEAYRARLAAESPESVREILRRSRPSGLSRRSFLAAAGFSLSAPLVGSCSREPFGQVVPGLERPEEVVPGLATWYASTCAGCSAGCGLLAKVRDGRPIKLEGNPQHPLSKGGLCPVGQAALLGLYDSRRLRQPLAAGRAVDWPEVDQTITRRLRSCEGRIEILTGTVTSPTTRAVIRRFLDHFGGRHTVYDPISYSSIADAYERLDGVRAIPHYRFAEASLIVSFDADFLGTWLSPVEFCRDYTAGRSLQGDPPRMSRHLHFEGRLSLTGSNADLRVPVSPGEMRNLMLAVAERLGRLAAGGPTGEDLPPSPADLPLAAQVADELWRCRGGSLVICGANEVGLQVLTALINRLLGNEGVTLDLGRPSYQWQGRDSEVAQLLERLAAGQVGALLIEGVNPAYSLPEAVAFPELLRRVPLTVAFSPEMDETARLTEFVCPTPHFLEAWNDAELAPGIWSLSQPAIRPLGNTRSLRESLLAWLGLPQPDPDAPRQYWREHIYPGSGSQDEFQSFWERCVHDGFLQVPTGSPPGGGTSSPAGGGRRSVSTVAALTSAVAEVRQNSGEEESGFSLILYEPISMRDGRHAHNPWLHELPDPITKAVWDNFVCMGPASAARLGISTGDVVRVSADSASLELPVLVQPGQHENVLAVALGYGRVGTDRFADVGPQWLQSAPTVEPGRTIGENGFRLTSLRDGVFRYSTPVVLSVTGRHTRVALTQTHDTLSVPEHLGGRRREVVHETTLEAFARNPHSGTPAEDELLQLWPDDFVYTGHHWGMAIDLNVCTGCSACVISCQAENNIPVVGKDEVYRRREMHWIRVDRYYADDAGSMRVVHQPVMCQHCDHAPCEPVCPVLATLHSREGINQQIYNRCVGTRYCANNCPYKVRRFNWFDYPREDPVQNLVLNPDVTVRSRGVMEKCSMCVQRIEAVRATALREGRRIGPTEIQPACAQSCPAGAIVFGDVNDPDSPISQIRKNPRHYRMLWEMNFRPSVGYLTKVRNTGAEGSAHGA